MRLRAFTQNSKTILSVDFSRTTCPQICEYCYVGNMERIYPSYKEKIKKNANWATGNYENFSSQLNDEYKSTRKSKSKKLRRVDKLPVRIYGSGDFIPEHLMFMKNLNFKFYIISKSLTSNFMHKYIDELLQLDNLTNLVLSFDSQNLDNYSGIRNLYGDDRISFAFTGMADEFKEVKVDKQFDIFFNISNKKIEKEKSKLYKEQCPCDSGAMAHNESCSFCNKCWKSSLTKGKDWNKEHI